MATKPEEQTQLDVPPAAKNWRSEMLDQFEITDAAGLSLLDAATVQLARLLDARERLKLDGIVVQDRFGQIQPHPLVAIEARATASFRMLLRELGVCEGPEQIEPIPRPKGRK